jgi:HK97 family phage major capsid protein
VQITDVAGRIGGGVTNGDSTGFALQGDPGEAFVKSEGYRKIADPATRGQRWSTGAVPLPNWSTKAGTVLESGQGAGLVPVPQVLPGVVETLFQPIEVTDLFATVQATSSSVRYAVEGTATSGAAGVAEGAAKPASDIALSTVDEPVKKIATSITVSDELLEDAASAQAFRRRPAEFVREAGGGAAVAPRQRNQ